MFLNFLHKTSIQENTYIYYDTTVKDVINNVQEICQKQKDCYNKPLTPLEVSEFKNTKKYTVVLRVDELVYHAQKNHLNYINHIVFKYWKFFKSMSIVSENKLYNNILSNGDIHDETIIDKQSNTEYRIKISVSQSIIPTIISYYLYHYGVYINNKLSKLDPSKHYLKHHAELQQKLIDVLIPLYQQENQYQKYPAVQQYIKNKIDIYSKSKHNKHKIRLVDTGFTYSIFFLETVDILKNGHILQIYNIRYYYGFPTEMLKLKNE